MSETIAGFFSGSQVAYWPKGRSAKVPTPVGETITGTILKVHEPEQQTDLTTRQPIPGKFQIRIELATDIRDPEVRDDDGTRMLYVKGWMTGAITDALRTAGVEQPQVGAKLAVTYTGNAPQTRPGLDGAKQYSAVYTPAPWPGTAPANGQPAAAPAPQNAPIPDSPPAGIDPAAWADMPPAAKQAIANVAAGVGN